MPATTFIYLFTYIKRPGNWLQKQPFKESLWMWTDSVPLPACSSHTTQYKTHLRKMQKASDTEFVITLLLTLWNDFIIGSEIFIISGVSCETAVLSDVFLLFISHTEPSPFDSHTSFLHPKVVPFLQDSYILERDYQSDGKRLSPLIFEFQR